MCKTTNKRKELKCICGSEKLKQDSIYFLEEDILMSLTCCDCSRSISRFYKLTGQHFYSQEYGVEFDY